MATVRRTRGVPETTPEIERRALRALAHTVPGVVSARIVTEAAADTGAAPPAGTAVDADASA